MPATTFELGLALIELANYTERLKGPMEPPGLAIRSAANQELKQDATWGNTNTIEQPVRDVLAHLELLFHASCDHVRSLGTLLIAEQPSWFGHVALARAAVETSCRIWLIGDDSIDARERVRRHLMEKQYEMNQQQTLLGGAYQTMPAPVHAALAQHVANVQQRMGNWAKAVGLMTQGNFVRGGRPGPTDLLVKLYEQDPAAAQGGQAGVLAAYSYNQESAVAHGLPSGVSMYFQAAPDPGGHGHNVLTAEHVGHVVLPVITAFNAAFDRLGKHFLWSRHELDVMRYPSIHAVTTMMEPQPPPT